MKKEDNSRLTRRKAIKVAAEKGLTLSIASSLVQAGPAKNNPIVRENRKQGSADWQLTRVRYDKSLQRTALIEGYCSRQSVKAGQQLDIMVSTSPQRSYRLDIYRTGYYGGLGGRLVKSIGPLKGKKQAVPAPEEKNLHECQWEVSTSFTIPEDWLSGVYLGKLRTLPEKEDEPYWESYIIFIVTDDRPVDLLFQCSDNTWQAYNR